MSDETPTIADYESVINQQQGIIAELRAQIVSERSQGDVLTPYMLKAIETTLLQSRQRQGSMNNESYVAWWHDCNDALKVVQQLMRRATGGAKEEL